MKKQNKLPDPIRLDAQGHRVRSQNPEKKTSKTPERRHSTFSCYIFIYITQRDWQEVTTTTIKMRNWSASVWLVGGGKEVCLWRALIEICRCLNSNFWGPFLFGFGLENSDLTPWFSTCWPGKWGVGQTLSRPRLGYSFLKSKCVDELI